MPKRINYGGQVHVFPDSFTDDDIAAALEQSSVESPDLGAGDRFVRGVASQLNPIAAIKGIAGAVANPKETFRGQLQAMDEQWEKAGQASNIPEAAGRAIAGSIPLIGPAAANIGERIGTGEDKATALGEGTGLVLSAGLPSAIQKGGSLALRGANKLRAPFAGEIDPAVSAATARTGAGIDLPAGAVSTSKPVATMEAIAMKGFGGDATAGRYVNAANELTSRANHLVARASKLATESERGVAIAKGFKSYRDAWIRTKNSLYNSAAIPPDLPAVPQSSVALLDEILANKAGAARITGGATDLSYFQKLREGLGAGPVSAADLRSVIQDLNGKIGGAHADAWSAANKQLLKKVAATLDDDFTTALKNGAPDVYAKLERANSVYADGLAKINSTFGKTINRLAKAGKYDDIARAVANANMSVDDIPRIMKVVGPEGTQAVRASVMADLVAKATKNGKLTPQGLRMALERFERSSPGALDALLEPGQAATLRDLSTLSQSLEKGLKVAEGSQTAFLGRMGVLAGTMVTKPIAGLKLLLGDIGFNKFISSEAGQKWMKGGYKPWTSPGINVDAPGTALGSVLATPGVTSGQSMQPVPAR